MSNRRKIFYFDRHRLKIFWAFQIISSYGMLRGFVSNPDTQAIPKTCAIATIGYFFIYTRQKAAHDNAARQMQMRLFDLISSEMAVLDRNQEYNNETNRLNLDHDIQMLKYDFSSEIYKLKNISKTEERNSFIHSSTFRNPSGLTRPRSVPPRVKMLPQHDTFNRNAENFKEAIAYNEKMAGNFFILEGFAIITTASFSGYGAEIVRWWHSSCWSGLPEFLSIVLVAQAC